MSSTTFNVTWRNLFHYSTLAVHAFIFILIALISELDNLYCVCDHSLLEVWFRTRWSWISSNYTSLKPKTVYSISSSSLLYAPEWDKLVENFATACTCIRVNRCACAGQPNMRQQNSPWHILVMAMLWLNMSTELHTVLCSSMVAFCCSLNIQLIDHIRFLNAKQCIVFCIYPNLESNIVILCWG